MSTVARAKRGQATPIVKVVRFNPLEKKVLGGAIAEVLLTTPVYPLAEPFPRRGPGIYAIYYSGDFAAYSAIANQNKEGRYLWPIYVGQALPSGGRRGTRMKDDDLALRGRIMNHHKSIKAATADLKVEHFHYRALVMDDAFIRLGETSLLALYRPIWNSYGDGFGNNKPGKRRETTKRSRWDTLHGGRSQAEPHTERGESRENIIAEIERELSATNFDLPSTLVNAAEQSDVMAPEMNFEDVVNMGSDGLDGSNGS